jgi:hypothetical protein
MKKGMTICVLLLFCLALNVYAQEVKTPTKKQDGVTKTEMKQKTTVDVKLVVSADGKAILDENGNEVARFNEGYKIKTSGNTKTLLRLPGCMRCTKECVRWDSTGKCIQTINSCTWDFDCKN